MSYAVSQSIVLGATVFSWSFFVLFYFFLSYMQFRREIGENRCGPGDCRSMKSSTNQRAEESSATAPKLLDFVE